ncbi:MAG TPA: protein kinase [Vicinamibacterales bacterium]|nr:protein kinase [Vicinamibacterales bacterium]
MLGTTLGHYRIERELGRGGMGEVYAARDLKLHRHVALKVLAAAFGTDSERRQRFAREAQAVAALNHPNIVTLYSVEQAGALDFLTMELVEGQPLDRLIPRDGLPLDRLLKLAVPLADAVSAAHHKGITHRDLKPANIIVSDDGRLKVLDFGLARLKEPSERASSVTVMPTQTVTGDGRILGTVAYMSPEQAEGKPVDHRSDIFSLGIALYEMSTGQRPFRGDSSVSLLSSILKDTPPSLTDVNRSLPRDLARIVRRCLMKDPEERYQSAKDIRNDLQELRQALESGVLTAAPDPTPRKPVRPRALFVAASAGAIGTLILASLFLIISRSGRSPHPAPAAFKQLTGQSGVEEFPSLSPDGRWLVYASDAAGNVDIYLQSVGGHTPINLTQDSTADDLQPAFSSDGERIVFRSERDGGGIFVMGRTGESVRRLTDVGFNPVLSPKGDEVAFATENVVTRPGARGRRSELWIVNVDSGARRQLAIDDAVQPSWSPHGIRIACWAARGPDRQRDILTLPAGGGEAVLVTDDAAVDWNPVWSPDGRHLYFASERGGSMNLWRVPIDEQSGRTLGPPEPVTLPSGFVAHVSLSADGRRLAFTSLEFEQNVQRLTFDPATDRIEGEPQPVTSGSRLWASVDVSRDGQWIALASDRPQEDLFVARADGTGLRQVTSDGAFDRAPRWSPDGKRIVFYSNRSGAWELSTIEADGSGLTQVTKKSGAHYPIWSPDGSQIAFTDIVDALQVYVIDARKPWDAQAPLRLPNPPGAVWRPSSWSPDGRLLAGVETTTTESGGGILIYSPGSRTFEKLTAHGREPYWLNDRRLIFTSRPGSLAIVDRVSKELREIPARPGQSFVLQAIAQGGRQLYVLLGSKEADIWMATLD